jgi:CBS domain-containing protein
MIFRDADCGAVPILKDGKAVGVLTDRDVALALASYPDLVSRPVEEIMTDEVITVDSTASIDAVREMFAEKTVRRLLVLGSHGELVGIIAWSDIAPYSSDRQVGEVVTETVEQP